MHHHRIEDHRVGRLGWLRAAVLGANDGIVSTASLITGIAASDVGHNTILIAGVAALVAGAMSMAAGEYVSVSSQSDSEKADIAKEKQELLTEPESELKELAGIYMKRGLDANLAKQVAEQLTAKDALKAHLRDELGITDLAKARPIQAAVVSALFFASGAGMPLIAAFLCPNDYLIHVVSGVSLIVLAVLGAFAAVIGGSSIVRGVWRVLFWGALAMALTTLVGNLIGAPV